MYFALFSNNINMMRQWLWWYG